MPSFPSRQRLSVGIVAGGRPHSDAAIDTRRGALQAYFLAPVAPTPARSPSVRVATARRPLRSSASSRTAVGCPRTSRSLLVGVIKCERFDARGEQACCAQTERARAVAMRTQIAERTTRRRRSDDDATRTLVDCFVHV